MTKKGQITDNCTVALSHDSQNDKYRCLSKIPDRLLTSIVQLSTLQENDKSESIYTKSSKTHILKPSPIQKDDPRMSDNSLELILDKLIFKLSSKNTNNVEGDDFNLKELAKVLKLCLLKIKQLSMSLDISKSDSRSKIDRLELERNMLLKDIEMIKRKQCSFLPHEKMVTPLPNQNKNYSNYLGQITPVSTPIKSPETRVHISSDSPSNEDQAKSKHSEHHSALFFHYYTSPADSGSDFSSIDNRRNKRRKKEKNK